MAGDALKLAISTRMFITRLGISDTRHLLDGQTERQAAGLRAR